MRLFPLLAVCLPGLAVLCCFSALAAPVPAVETPEPLTLTRLIEETLQTPCLDPEQTAVSIVGAPDGRLVYAYNAGRPLLPASVVKMVTTAATLHYLGPEYRFKTDILYSGKRLDTVIEGDLIIRAGGDPKLSHADVIRIAEQIYQAGIRQVTGHFMVDTGFFDTMDRAPHWQKERSQQPYDAKLGVLSLNYNVVRVHLRPGNHIDEEIAAWLEPAPRYLKLLNLAQTTRRHHKDTVWAQRSRENGESRVQIEGKLPLGSAGKVIALNVDNPLRFAAETFRAALADAGVMIAGNTLLHGTTPPRAQRLYRHESPSLSLILKELNTYSNNFVAEQTLKAMSAEVLGKPGSHEKGTRLLQHFLTRLGVNTRGVQLVDASGLSRANRMTTRAVTELLVKVLPRFDLGPDFMAALRVLGANGVYSNRFKNSPAKAKVRAKTGSLWKVSNLAGYVSGAQGGLYAYALFLNNNTCGGRWADELEDRIVDAIHTFDKGRQGDVPLVSSLWLAPAAKHNMSGMTGVSLR